MAIKINFDMAHNPEEPTLILAKRNGDKLGLIKAKSVEVSDAMKDASEITFNVYKYIDNKVYDLWEQITDFKLVHCVEWDVWFEIKVELDEATETIKTVFCTRLGQAELSQIMLYDIEINTENDIARDDYTAPTILFNPDNPKSSLLHRMMEKAPHYSIIHVDDTIANIQRTFTFNDTSIKDGFNDIEEEINCLFVFPSNSDSQGNIQRTIAVYDLESNCNQCGHRGEFTGVCPECGSSEINEGYGNDTSIFVTSDELADDIQLTTDTNAIKNCFKLVAGDDLMTATIRNCNPNGTDYLWYISDDVKKDMSPKLVDKINSYNEIYAYYHKDYISILDEVVLLQYNTLVKKYQNYNSDLEEIEMPIRGYSALMNAYYDTIDLELYLQSALMPDVSMSDTDAKQEVLKLTTENLSPVAVNNIAYVSSATADSAVLAMAKIIIDSRYKVKVETSSFANNGSAYIWTGNFNVTNYSDEEDTAISETISIVVNGDYATFVKQKLDKSLNKNDSDDLSISGLFKKEYDDFVLELKKYSLNRLKSFYDACQSCIDILIEQGVSDKETWSGQDPSLYDDLYIVYLQKLSAIEAEIKVRQSEIDLIIGIYDENGELKTYGLQNYILDIKSNIQNKLNFESYLGTDLWLEFCTFRREDKYSNDNYISDGLNNVELFNNANNFIQVAQREIYKSAELQHSITSTLKNLLAMQKFQSLVDDFQIGNWLRVMIDDEVYKLRLIEYSLNYDDFNNISVTFSDTVKASSTVKSVQEVIEQASNMATSYNSVKRQAKQGEESNSILKNWTSNGLDATNTKIVGGADNQTQTWDEHGMLFKEYDSITETYSPTQLKIINSTVAITDNNWESTKTAIGKFNYVDPKTSEIKSAYGINGEVIIGKLLIGEGLGIYNQTGSLTFDENGFAVSNDINTVIINPNDDSVFNIRNKDGNVLSFDEYGNLVIVGDITARSLTLLDNTEINAGHISGLSDVAISGNYEDLDNLPNLSDVALSGKYEDLIDAPNMNSKFNIPTNDTSAIVGQYLSKQSNGSKWVDAETTIEANGILPICGKAVYNFALGKKQDVSNAEKLLYVGSDGTITFINIDDLKSLLGI